MTISNELVSPNVLSVLILDLRVEQSISRAIIPEPTHHREQPTPAPCAPSATTGSSSPISLLCKFPLFSWPRGCIPWLLMRVNWTLVSVAAANRPCHNLPEENKVRNKRESKQLGNLKYEHCQWTYLHSDPQNTPLQEQTLKKYTEN